MLYRYRAPMCTITARLHVMQNLPHLLLVINAMNFVLLVSGRCAHFDARKSCAQVVQVARSKRKT